MHPMKVVDRDPEGGVTILDPVGLARIIANSKRGFASGVLTLRLFAAYTPRSTPNIIIKYLNTK
jgi:hypothetical protein